MNKNIYLNSLLFVLLLAVGSSCKKQYLETDPKSQASPDLVFSTTTNAKLAVNGLAKSMTMQYLGSQGFNGEGTIKMYYGNYPGNHFTVNLPGWAAIINAEFNENTTSIYLYYPWYYYYKIIGNANTIIARIDGAEGPESEKAMIKAQALAYRAYCYMMLVQLYSNRWKDSNNGASKGVVLRLDESTSDMPLATLKDIYDQIYLDLDESLSLFGSSGYTRPANKNFEINIDVARAIYARAALNKEDYPKAEQMAKSARQNYPLMSVAQYKTGFNTPTSEWIWSSYGAEDETLYFYSYHAYIAYNSTASAVRTTPKMISKELFDKIPATDMRRALFLDPDTAAYASTTGQAAAKSFLDAKARKLYPALQSNATVFAYMQFKVSAAAMAGVGHLNHFRSSEMLLIEAEAKYYQGAPATDIQNLLIELNKTSGRNPDYTTSNTGVDLLNEIKLYRGIELWGEGFDWFDLKRWKDPVVRKAFGNGGSFVAALAKTIQPNEVNNWTWKIPNREFDYNTLIEQ